MVPIMDQVSSHSSTNRNARIDDGQIAGEKITVSALMINKYVECTFVELD